MKFLSTRGNASVTGAAAIVGGISPDGGLFCPESFPALTTDVLRDLSSLTYAGRVAAVLGMYLDEYSSDELERYAELAYAGFDCVSEPAPVRHLDDSISLLELWHGPTAAFKDMALQILPFLLNAGAKKIGETRRICILTATSGDTGKAALEGFKDREGTAVFVFYPVDGVSHIQRLQMVTQEGRNVGVSAIHGNFDNAQTGVKQIFSDKKLADELSDLGWLLSSANSINLGRLLPQVAYYISAYCDMTATGRLAFGEEIDITVPTGNFGNILAAYYAKSMGLPVGRLICASNTNDVLTVFLRTGVYDRRRKLALTTSPSMDILVSSNFERALYHLSGRDTGLIKDLMRRLSDDGVYTAPDSLRSEFQTQFAGDSCNDATASQVIRDTWRERKTLVDPHTAVALYAARRNLSKNPMLVVSTASPFKFGESVCQALGATAPGGASAMDALSAHTGLTPPSPLGGLSERPERFTQTVDIDGMRSEVIKFVKGQ